MRGGWEVDVSSGRKLAWEKAVLVRRYELYKYRVGGAVVFDVIFSQMTSQFVANIRQQRYRQSICSSHSDSELVSCLTEALPALDFHLEASIV